MIAQVFKSKTIVVGALITLASAVEAFMPYLPKEYVGLVGTGVGVAMIVLRFLTTLPLDQK